MPLLYEYECLKMDRNFTSGKWGENLTASCTWDNLRILYILKRNTAMFYQCNINVYTGKDKE